MDGREDVRTEAGKRGSPAIVGSAVLLVLANVLTAYLMYPAFTSSDLDASVGVPLLIAFHLALGTDWLTSTLARAGWVTMWWCVPPTLLALASLGRMSAFID
ncbi:hypothetical protein ABZ348_33365 [Streptomyces sp. NPDC005963]|uniref:hypothetical protein n=1 Tax=Streptomyces sp. NPDC005963 TaxID=3156721 RepID=UPI0033ED6F28